ncbi:MAG: galactose mutarotase [Sphingobacteriales bacterium]|nr:MAG: galactose mutarotase [Sphingobacteriales bacterium]
MKIEKKQWGRYRGDTVWFYTIRNGQMEVDLTNYGCTILAIRIGGRNIICGYTSLSDLLADPYYMGCLVGRFAGRIARAAFTINEVAYQLPANDGATGHHLHGGPNGFNQICFKEASQHWGQDHAIITFQTNIEHLHQGYPGNIDLGVAITLNNRNQLTFNYQAQPDRPTHINLTHHLYYNLCSHVVHSMADGTADPIPQQELTLYADAMLETATDYIPTGRIIPVTAEYDFRVARLIPAATAYNECYVLKQPKKSGMDAVLADPVSGLTMELSTTCPGIIFYTGDFLNAPFSPRQGICLEAQYFPDTPNHKSFPSTLYNQFRNYREQTILQFKNLL